MKAPIGVFDSGYGGLTVLRELVKALPRYDFIYLGDNARTPYGPRSFNVVYEYSLEAVRYLLSRNCPLIILACNTASAKALRNIQQLDLPSLAPECRVLGVIRPSVQKAAEMTRTGHVGVLGTLGTVVSESYPMELAKWSAGKVVATVQEACPMWVPLVENNEIASEGADFFVKQHITALLEKDRQLDTIILACTHYPLLQGLINRHLPGHVRALEQGLVVVEKLKDYLQRHPEIERRLSRHGTVVYRTTESAETFAQRAALFVGQRVEAQRIRL